MGYRLIVFDIDGTIAKHVSSWRYLHEKFRLWDNVADKYQRQFLSGKIGYKKFCELDAAHWKGLPEKEIKDLFEKAPYVKNASRYVKSLKRKGFKLIALSTGLQYMADRVKRELGFDCVVANKLISHKGALTGKVEINISHRGKGVIFKKILRKFHVMPNEVISVGDSAGDLPLIKQSGYSIAFNSSDKKFSRAVDYNCKTDDFKEVYEKILSVSA